MITNLLATVVITLVTNTTEVVTGYDGHEPTSCPDAAAYPNTSCLVMHYRGVGPNAKTVTTTVTEVTTYVCDLNGTKQELARQSRVIDTKSVYWSKQWQQVDAPIVPKFDASSWQKSGVWTNAALNNVLVFTNRSLIVPIPAPHP